MSRKILPHLLLALLALPLSFQPASADQPAPTHKTAKAKKHRIVMQVTDGSHYKWNEALINIKNIQNELGRRNVVIDLVVYDAAIDMLKLESEVAPRVAEAIASGVKVVACQNTMQALGLTDADMLPGIGYTPAGVVYLMLRQEEGYAYVKP